MKPLITACAITIFCNTLLAQGRTPLDIKALNQRIDSIVDAKSKEYEQRLELMNSRIYIKQLEQVNSLQGGNNGYYEVLFGAMGIIVGLLTIWIVYNAFVSKKEFKDNLKEQTDKYNLIVSAQQANFKKTVESQEDAFRSLEEKFSTAVNELILNAQEEVQNEISKIPAPEHENLTKSLQQLEAKYEKLLRLVDTPIRPSNSMARVAATLTHIDNSLTAVPVREKETSPLGSKANPVMATSKSLLQNASQLFGTREITCANTTCQKSFFVKETGYASAMAFGYLQAKCPYCGSINNISKDLSVSVTSENT